MGYQNGLLSINYRQYPLSRRNLSARCLFLMSPSKVYIDAILGGYELNRIELLHDDLFLLMFVIVGFFVMVRMIMLMLGGNLRFMLMAMG